MSRVLVTGATGFVGRHLVQALHSRGTDIVVAARDPARLQLDCPPVAVVQFNLETPGHLVPEQLEGVDVVYHLAARVHVMRADSEDEGKFHQLNVRATEVLAETAARAGVRRLVYLSSIKVNGERTSGQSFKESDTPAPLDGYGRSKLAAERSLLCVAEKTGLEVVIVRPPLVYGPGVGANFRRLLQLVDANWPLPFGAITNRRSLVSVWNLVSLMTQVQSLDSAAGRVCLVSDGSDVSTPQLLQLISKALGKTRTRLLPVPVNVLRAVAAMSGRSAEIGRLVDSLQVDISATRHMLGWAPPMSIDEGISRTVAWFRAVPRAT